MERSDRKEVNAYKSMVSNHFQIKYTPERCFALKTCLNTSKDSGTGSFFCQSLKLLYSVLTTFLN